MSRNNFSNSSNNSRVNQKGGNTRPPFCKVCFDAKKPKEVYESHFVKDREGKVTCVTLLEQECRYCYKKGHTVKFCPAVAANNSAREKAEYKNRRQEEAEERQRRQDQEKKSKSKMNAAVQALFNDDSDDEQEKIQAQAKQMQAKQMQAKQMQAKQKEEFPALGAPSQRVQTSKPSFASALQKNPLQVQKERVEEEKTRVQAAGFTVLSRNTNGTTKKEEPKMPSSMPSTLEPVFCNPSKKLTSSWLSSDSDSEDDDEAYFAPNVTIRSKATLSFGVQPDEDW
jgi:hypothetical protein